MVIHANTALSAVLYLLILYPGFRRYATTSGAKDVQPLRGLGENQVVLSAALSPNTPHPDHSCKRDRPKGPILAL